MTDITKRNDNNKITCLALCEARHEMPDCVQGAIFKNTIDPLDVAGLELKATVKLYQFEVKELHLYVTGLTVALIAVLNAAKKCNIPVTLYHYNRNNNEYYPQKVEF